MNATAPDSQEQNKRPSCSVLICTYNRPLMLAACLSALIERTVDRPEQVVVVNGGDERTDQVIEEILPTSQKLGVNLSCINTANKNLAASRNVGLPHCTGEIVAMTDDDAQVFPDWVAEIKRAHQMRPEAGAVGGPVIGVDSKTLLSRVSDQVTFPSYAMGCTVRTLPGVNVSYKRRVVEEVGCQDETLFRGEDVDYNWRVQKLGWGIWFDPRVRVFHHHRPTLRGFLNQHYMYGRAYYRVRRKWPDMYCVYPHALRSTRDWTRALNFVAALAYEPLLDARRLEGWQDKLAAYPIMLLDQFVWRAGMVREALAAN